MAATLAATFTLISCVQGSLCIIIKIHYLRNPVQSVVGETLNCKREVNNPRDLYTVDLRQYGTTVGLYYVLLFLIRHGGVIKATLNGSRPRLGPRQYCRIPKTLHREV